MTPVPSRLRRASSALLTVMLSAAPALGTTIVVDGQGGGDFLTIQSAIDSAAPGDTILVMAGTYIEDLLVHEEVIIKSNSGTGATFILPSTSSPGTGTTPDLDTATHLIQVTASNVTIEGFTLDGENPLLPSSPDARTAVILDSRLGPVNNLIVKSCVIKNIHFRGIHLFGSGTGSVIQSNTFDNIDAEVGASGAISVMDVPVTISGSFITNSLFGIALLAGTSGSLTSNTASGLPLGFEISNNTGVVTLTSNRALGCTTGFQCSQNQANVLLDRGIANGCNKAVLIYGGAAPSANVDVVAHNIDGASSPSSIGIATNTQLPSLTNGDVRATLRQNSIKKTGNAIVLEEVVPTLTTSNVTVGGSETDKNHFYNTIDQMLKLVGTNDNINARSNFWGTSQPSEIELVVTHKVDVVALGFVDYSDQLDGKPHVAVSGSNKIGEQATINLRGLYLETFILFLSLGPGEVPLPPFGILLLNPAFLRRVTSSTFPPSGQLNITGTIPNDPNLVGVSIYFQSLVGFDIFAGVGTFSNVAVLTIAPST